MLFHATRDCIPRVMTWRARISGSCIAVSLNSRLESTEEEENDLEGDFLEVEVARKVHCRHDVPAHPIRKRLYGMFLHTRSGRTPLRETSGGCSREEKMSDRPRVKYQLVYLSIRRLTPMEVAREVRCRQKMRDLVNTDTKNRH